MSRTQWVLETNGSDAIEINGHKFGSSDEGAPMMCNLYCKDMGRHAHIDFCRADDPAQCSEKDTHHISERMEPDPDKSKDWITHELYWKRSGALFSDLSAPRAYFLYITGFKGKTDKHP